MVVLYPRELAALSAASPHNATVKDALGAEVDGSLAGGAAQLALSWQSPQANVEGRFKEGNSAYCFSSALVF